MAQHTCWRDFSNIIKILPNSRSSHSPAFIRITVTRTSCPELFCKKGALRNSTKLTGKHLCQSLFFKTKLQAWVKFKWRKSLSLFKKVSRLYGCSSTKKETPSWIFSCEFVKSLKNRFSTDHLQMTASEMRFTAIKNFFTNVLGLIQNQG